MKKIIVICLAVLLLSGCQAPNVSNSNIQGSSSADNEPHNSTNNSEIKNDPSDIFIDNSELDLSGFQRNMNVKSPLRLPTACKTEKGYYLQNEGLLYFLDSELGKMIVVCGKPECPHNDVDCNAWINSRLLSYYDGKLYYVNGDAIHNSYKTLCRMNLDGTNHTDVQVIQTSEPGWNVNCADPIFVNGTIYFMERDHSVYRAELGQKVENAVKLIDGEPEETHQTSEWKFWTDNSNAYAMNRYMDNNGDEQDQLYLLGENSENTKKIWNSSQIINSISNNASWYIMNRHLYYYTSENELWDIDLNSGNSEKITLSENTKGGDAVFTDENIIILSADGKNVIVFDHSGTEIADIDLSSIYQTYSDIFSVDLIFVDSGNVFLLAYHKVFLSPSSALYQIDWKNKQMRELDTWPGAAVDFKQEDNEHWIQVG